MCNLANSQGIATRLVNNGSPVYGDWQSQIKHAKSYIQIATHRSAQDLPPQSGISLADVQAGELKSHAVEWSI
jgi:hypothetical protein